MLAPDLGLAYAPTIQFDDPQHDVGWFMRDDCERQQPTVAANCGDPALLAATAEDYLRIAASYRVIHTDRLHFAIAAMIAGRQAHLYANSYFKNEAIYHLWLRGRGCQWAECVDRPNHAMSEVESILQISEKAATLPGQALTIALLLILGCIVRYQHKQREKADLERRVS